MVEIPRIRGRRGGNEICEARIVVGRSNWIIRVQKESKAPPSSSRRGTLGSQVTPLSVGTCLGTHHPERVRCYSSSLTHTKALLSIL